MLMVYMIPFVARPIDFVQNFSSYVFGLITYILLMPTFTSIFQIYGMCNLHDISWGNRPAVVPGAAGTNQMMILERTLPAKKRKVTLGSELEIQKTTLGLDKSTSSPAAESLCLWYT